MKLTWVTCAALCLQVAFVSGAEESPDGSITSGDVKDTTLEQDDHGPLMKAILTPGEGTSTLHREKRTWGGKKGGGGCCSGGGGCCRGGGGSWSTSQSSSGTYSGKK